MEAARNLNRDVEPQLHTQLAAVLEPPVKVTAVDILDEEPRQTGDLLHVVGGADVGMDAERNPCLGLTEETVCRQMAELRRERVLYAPRGRIEILDWNALQDAANEVHAITA